MSDFIITISGGLHNTYKWILGLGRWVVTGLDNVGKDICSNEGTNPDLPLVYTS